MGHRFGWVLLAGILAGCSGESTRTVTTTRRTLSDPLLERYAGNYQKVKGEDGSMRIVSDRRSQYEGRKADGYRKSIANKRYATNEREKSSWWGGRKDYGNKTWRGAKQAPDAGKKSWFASKQAPQGNQIARASGKQYRTGEYETGAAYEAGTRRLGHPRDARVENRRASSPKPEIIGWEEQRKMSMEQTRSILGR